MSTGAAPGSGRPRQDAPRSALDSAAPRRTLAASAPLHWRVIGRSVAGPAHVARGLPCQDALAWRELPDGSLILAVADGAGSAARSELGAAAAVEALVDALAMTLEGPAPAALVPDEADADETTSSIPAAGGDRGLDSSRSASTAEPDWREAVIPFDVEEPELSEPGPPPRGSGAVTLDPLQAALHASVAAARAGLEALAAAQGRPLREYACTLTAVLALPEGLWVAQIGDSVAVARDAAGSWQTVGRPQKGEYANEAWFLTAEGAMNQLEIRAFEMDARQIILSSDGLLRLMLQLPGFAPHAPFLDPLARALTRTADPERAGQQLAAFLSSDRLRARSDDDISLLWAAREAASIPGSSRRDASGSNSAVSPGSGTMPAGAGDSGPLAPPSLGR